MVSREEQELDDRFWASSRGNHISRSAGRARRPVRALRCKTKLLTNSVQSTMSITRGQWSCGGELVSLVALRLLDLNCLKARQF